MWRRRRKASWTSLAPRKCRTSSPLLSAGLYELYEEEEVEVTGGCVAGEIQSWVLPYESWRDSTTAESATSRAATIEEGGAGRMQGYNSRQPSSGG